MNKEGIAYTLLRPAGKVKIGEQVFDAVSLVGFIEKGETIMVVSYRNSQLVVKKK